MSHQVLGPVLEGFLRCGVGVDSPHDTNNCSAGFRFEKNLWSFSRRGNRPQPRSFSLGLWTFSVFLLSFFIFLSVAKLLIKLFCSGPWQLELAAGKGQTMSAEPPGWTHGLTL